MIGSVEFASCYVYSPNGAGEVCERSRLLRELLKEGNERFINRYVMRVQQQIAESSNLKGFLSASDMLVPVPGSTPGGRKGRRVPARLAEALVRQGLGCDTWNGLKRIRPVQKSGTAPRCARPTVTLHYESFEIETLANAPRSLVLVDDVITKGRTLLAAAARLHEAFPEAQIRSFALLRTMGLIPKLRRLLEPCKGSICWSAGDARRMP